MEVGLEEKKQEEGRLLSRPWLERRSAVNGFKGIFGKRIRRSCYASPLLPVMSSREFSPEPNTQQVSQLEAVGQLSSLAWVLLEGDLSG